MQLISIVSIALALAGPSFGAILHCKRPRQPYCCTSATGVPDLGVSVGVACEKVPHGKVPKCPAGSVKICCSNSAVDIAGLVNLCDLPSGLLTEVGTLLGPLGGGGLGGGLGGILGGGLGIGKRELEDEADEE